MCIPGVRLISIHHHTLVREGSHLRGHAGNTTPATISPSESFASPARGPAKNDLMRGSGWDGALIS